MFLCVVCVEEDKQFTAVSEIGKLKFTAQSWREASFQHTHLCSTPGPSLTSGLWILPNRPHLGVLFCRDVVDRYVRFNLTTSRGPLKTGSPALNMFALKMSDKNPPQKEKADVTSVTESPECPEVHS